MDVALLAPVISLHLILLATGAQSAATLMVANNCKYTVWPALTSNNGNLPTTGFSLASGQSKSIQAPTGWTGRLWGRTFCATDPVNFKFRCTTGDCGSGFMECPVGKMEPPATTVEFNLDGDGGLDYFGVSLADGFNVPVDVVPEMLPGGSVSSGHCDVSGCPVDLNRSCPKELAVPTLAEVVACKSACVAFNSDEYCCTGAYGKPETCPENSYTKFFKDACPRAITYAFDSSGSSLTCVAGSTNYRITFCPSAGTYGIYALLLFPSLLRLAFFSLIVAVVAVFLPMFT